MPECGTVVTDTNYVATLRTCVICDLDGTLATIGARSPYDAAKCLLDDLNVPVAECLYALRARGHRIVFMSGRQEKDREPTQEWIKDKLIWDGRGWDPGEDYDLYMRATGDSRPDQIIKRELFDAHIHNKFRVMVWFDDRRRVIKMAREDLGLPVFAVNGGPAEKDDCVHCSGSGTSKALQGDEKAASEALSDLCGLPSWEPHGQAADRAVKALIKAVAKGRAR